MTLGQETKCAYSTAAEPTRLAPLWVHSTPCCQQPPEWSVPGLVDCISPW